MTVDRSRKSLVSFFDPQGPGTTTGILELVLSARKNLRGEESHLVVDGFQIKNLLYCVLHTRGAGMPTLLDDRLRLQKLGNLLLGQQNTNIGRVLLHLV